MNDQPPFGLIYSAKVGARDLVRACTFYDAVMGSFGLTRAADPDPGWAGWRFPSV
jgi:hypothetical protein